MSKIAEMLAAKRKAQEQAEGQRQHLVAQPIDPIKEEAAIDSLAALKLDQKLTQMANTVCAAPTTATIEPARKMSLAERIAAMKAASQARALAVESASVLNSGYEEEEAKALVPATDLAAGTASGAPGYVAALEDTATATHHHTTFDLAIELNAKQLQAKDMAMAGQSFCLIGPAGSGKTTTQREVAQTLLEQGRLKSCSFKPAGGGGERVFGPSIAFVAYTRRAAANLARAVHKKPELEEALRHNIMTIHALLEYQPVFYYDSELERETMRFEPQRHCLNPLDITHLVIEEASMVGLDLWAKLFDALRPGVQIIFIGDINQLPPVFGPSILNYALVQLPVVELDKVYRQAGDSRILGNAHRILAGNTELELGDDFMLMEGKSPIQVGQSKMAITLAKIFEAWHNDGTYDPEQDMILSPYNKQDLGTDNMNKFIAQFIGAKRGAVVWEVISGFQKLYLAVGDRVMCNKQDGVIVEIVNNGNYMGQAPQPPSKALSRFGVIIRGMGDEDDVDHEDADGTLSYENFSLAALEEQEIERKQQSSHIIKVRLLDNDEVVELSSSGDLNPQVFSLGYCLTVHKAQGCEWRKVYFILHKDHATMRYRELVYTAVTRAREQLLWIAKKVYVDQAIKNARIKGNCLADKIAYFNANLDMASQIACVK